MQAAAAVAWSSFLAACIGTMLVFAALDPQVIIDANADSASGAGRWWLTRTGIYSLGFFLLWAVAAVAGVLTAFLQHRPADGDGP